MHAKLSIDLIRRRVPTYLRTYLRNLFLTNFSYHKGHVRWGHIAAFSRKGQTPNQRRW